MPVILSRGPKEEPITNVPHRVTRGEAKNIDQMAYDFGYHGAGPNELSMNILFNTGLLTEAEALALSTFFTQDIICGIPHNGASIDDQIINEWIAMKRQNNII